MKRQLSLILVAFFLLLLPAFAIGEPSQQSNKLYFKPYYVASVSASANTSFNFTIDPPDGFTKTVSAVLNFQIYGSPTLNIYLWVDNKSCTPHPFIVDTRWATASLLPFSFDCSNVINHTGTYQAKLFVGKDSGSVLGSIDFTYINRPMGQMSVKGTEYIRGESGTIFLQLTDAYGQPIDSASCFTDIYYPRSYDTNHSALVEEVPMLFKEEGLYYYDLTVPSYEGVYMALASCRYGHNNYFWLNDLTHFPEVTVIAGTSLVGDAQVLNAYSDAAYLHNEATVQSNGNIDTNFTFYNVTSPTNATVATAQVFFETRGSGTMTGRVWNYTSGKWTTGVTFSTTGTGQSYPLLIDEYVGVTVPYSADLNQNGTMKLRFNGTGTGDVFWNAIWITLYNFNPQYVPIYGSGEMHVSSAGYSPFTFTTLCGDDCSDCARFYSNPMFIQGSMYDNITLSAGQTQTEHWEYTTPPMQSCDSIMNITVSNVSFSSGMTAVDFSGFHKVVTDNMGCKIDITLSAKRGDTYYYTIDMANFMKYYATTSANILQQVNKTVWPYCQNFANGSYNFPIPAYLTSYIPNGTDDNSTTLRACARVLDGLFWSEYRYQISQAITTSGEYSSYEAELKRAVNDLQGGVLMLTNVASTGSQQSVLNTGLLHQVLSNLSSANTTLHGSLASNFTAVATGQSQILGNLTSINTTLLAVNTSIYGQFASVLAAVQSTNTTIHNALYQNGSAILSAISGINASLNSALASNFTSVQASISSVNSSVLSALSSGLLNTNNLIIYANGTIHSAMAGNFTNTNGLISALDGKVVSANLTIHSALASNFSLVRADIASVNNSVSLWIWGNFTSTNALISALNSAMAGNFTYTNSLIQNVSVNLTPVLNAINFANQTIHDAIGNNATYTNALILSVNNTPVIDFSSVLAAIASTNSSLHSGMASNFTYTNGLIVAGNVNLTVVLDALALTNTSIHSALALNSSGVLTAISNHNQSMYDQITALASNMTSNFNYTNGLIITGNVNLTPVLDSVYLANQSIHSALAGNFSNTNWLIISVNNTPVIDLTPVLNSIDYANTTIHSALSDVNTSLFGQGGIILNAVYSTQADVQSTNSTLHADITSNFATTNNKIDFLASALNYMNTTIHNALALNFTALFSTITDLHNSVVYANNSIHAALAQNTSAILADIQSANTTIHSSISESTATILSALWGNFTQAFNNLFDINYNVVAANNSIHSNVNSQFDQLNTNLIGNFTEKDLAIESTNRTLHDAISANGSATLNAISTVGNDVISTNDTLHSSLTSESSTIQNLIIGTNSTLYNYLTAIGTYFDNLFSLHASTMEANFSYTNGLILGVNGTVGQCPSANNISNTVWNWPTRTLTEWNGVINNFWNSKENTCAPKATPPSDTVGNTPKEPAQSKIGNTESGDECGVGCRLTGWVDGLFGGGTP